MIPQRQNPFADYLRYSYPPVSSLDRVWSLVFPGSAFDADLLPSSVLFSLRVDELHASSGSERSNVDDGISCTTSRVAQGIHSYILTCSDFRVRITDVEKSIVCQCLGKICVFCGAT